MKEGTHVTASAISFGNHTDVGLVRDENQDYFGYYNLPAGELFVVCDGMGGYTGGEVASRIAVETIRASCASNEARDPAILLDRALRAANGEILAEAQRRPELKGMGSTCVAILLHLGKKPGACLAHVGDSRIYCIRRNQIYRWTKDHSRVSELVEKGLISEEEAEVHPQRNLITRALGAKDDVVPEITNQNLYLGDRIILCTDGVSGKVRDQELVAALAGKSPQQAAKWLVDLANQRGGEDNSTVQVIDILKGPKPPKAEKVRPTPQAAGKERKSIHLMIATSVVLLITAGAFAVLLFRPDGTKRVNQYLDQRARYVEMRALPGTKPGKARETGTLFGSFDRVSATKYSYPLSNGDTLALWKIDVQLLAREIQAKRVQMPNIIWDELHALVPWDSCGHVVQRATFSDPIGPTKADSD